MLLQILVLQNILVINMNVFRNIHNLCKVGGIFIHAVPLIGHWNGGYHKEAHHYSLDFFKYLAQQNDYETCIMKIFQRKFHNSGKPIKPILKHNVVCAAMIKNSNQDFNSLKNFESLFKFMTLGKSGMDKKYGKGLN